jgi:hypothetical protein
MERPAGKEGMQATCRLRRNLSSSRPCSRAVHYQRPRAGNLSPFTAIFMPGGSTRTVT